MRPTSDPDPRDPAPLSGDGTLPPTPESVWRRGLLMLVLVLLVNLAQAVIGLVGLIQFLWMLIARERNAALAEFAEGLGSWLAITARFVGGSSDALPFPWTRWR